MKKVLLIAVAVFMAVNIYGWGNANNGVYDLMKIAGRDSITDTMSVVIPVPKTFSGKLTLYMYSPDSIHYITVGADTTDSILYDYNLSVSVMISPFKDSLFTISAFISDIKETYHTHFLTQMMNTVYYDTSFIRNSEISIMLFDSYEFLTYAGGEFFASFTPCFNFVKIVFNNFSQKHQGETETPIPFKGKLYLMMFGSSKILHFEKSSGGYE